MPFSEGVSTHKTTFQELQDETNLRKKRTVSKDDTAKALQHHYTAVQWQQQLY